MTASEGTRATSDDAVPVVVREGREAISALDVGVGMATSVLTGPVVRTVDVLGTAARRAARLTSPVGVLVLRPPLVPQRLQPGSILADLACLGRRRRATLQHDVGAVLDRMVPRLADELVGRLDLDALVTRIDLTRLARTVIAEVDLPEIIRDSTGVVSSDAVREVRTRAVSGDDAVARVVDRLLLRHRQVPTSSGTKR